MVDMPVIKRLFNFYDILNLIIIRIQFKTCKRLFSKIEIKIRGNEFKSSFRQKFMRTTFFDKNASSEKNI